MGYRGSKSEIFNKMLTTFDPQPNQVSVKEQRVDGSWDLLKSTAPSASKCKSLRCTLTGFERNHQVKIPSKQLNNRLFYSTQVQQPQIDLNKQNIEPWFITGFTDAYGCFSIQIQPNAKLKTKWRVRPVFSITLHIKDAFLLEAIKNSLGVGNISKSSKTVIFAVDSIKEIPVNLNHFDNYPLLTQKLSDYLIFKECFKIIKDHLSEKGLLELISLKSSLNLGLPANLKLAFPNVIAKDRPQYKFKGISNRNPFWISGFVSGEGSFHIVVRKPENKSITGEVFARFSIHLHVRDIAVL